MHDFERLTEIRQSRLGRLRRVESDKQAITNEKRDTLIDAQAQVETFRKQVATLEIDLLTEIVGSEITPQTIFNLEKKLKEAERQALYLAEKVEDAQKELSAAEVNVETARKERFAAQRKQERLQQLNEHFLEQHKREALLAEDRAMDEVVDVLNAVRGVR